MTIKFGEVRINDTSKDHILDCIKRNHVTMGPKVKLLEKLWLDKFGYASVKAVSSGTAALQAAFMALYFDPKVKPGMDIIIPALSFIATANAVRAAGFNPVFCDVKIDSMLIDEDKVEDLITENTVALVPVTLMGKPPNMRRLRDIADSRNLVLIVDNCEGHGCKHDGSYMSAFGDMVVYSCFAAHILFSGEMGLVGCSTEEWGNRVESVRSHGRKPGTNYFTHEHFGLNLKPTDIHAAIGIGSMEDFDETMRLRKNNQVYLLEELSSLSEYFWFTEEEGGDYNSPHGFSFTVKPGTKVSVEGLRGCLTGADIEWKRNFGSMPEHGCFKYLNLDTTKCPNARYIGNNGIHIGCHQYLTTWDLEHIVNSVNKYVNSCQ